MLLLINQCSYIVSHFQLSHQNKLALPEEIILVYGSLDTGGIETLIVRIANYFALFDIRVIVCYNAGSELISLLDSRVDIIKYREISDLKKLIRRFHKKIDNLENILIMSFDPISAARALMIESVFSSYPHVTHISGVFHPSAYFMLGTRKDRVFLNNHVAMAIGKRQIFFMNEECRKAHEVEWNTNLSTSPLFALPINYVDAKWHPSKQKIVRVVSVGRLVGFKAYNVGSAKIVKSCLDKGIEVIWDIYGYGVESEKIQLEIDLLKVGNSVRLMGKLDYIDFESTIVSYDLFVGMGTAALEAAMIGVPTICATIDEPVYCYGYLQELPFGNVGELQYVPPSVRITELIEKFSTMDVNERAFLSIQSHEAAKKYGLPMFAESIADMASKIHKTPGKLRKRAVAEIYRIVTEGYVVKGLRRSMARIMGSS